MGIYRQYFEKNNTIIKNSEVNTGNNPVAELSYGSRVTRFLFRLDLDPLKDKIQNFAIDPDSNYKVYVRLKSTLEFSINPYLGDFDQIQLDSTSRPSGFNLELHEVPEFWDEGVGYDFSLNTTRRAEDREFVKGKSNWYDRSDDDAWTTAGAIPTGSTAIATQYFDKGHEDVEMDITDFVKNKLENDATAIDLCLKYADNLEITGGDTQYTTGYFTRHTQTFFEPFMEVVFDDVLKDDRNKFYLLKENRLYLYVNVDGKLTNLTQLPTCTIAADNGSATYQVTQQSTGVYYVTVPADEDRFTTYKKYFDVWSGLEGDNGPLKDVKLSFIPKDETEYYQLGDEMVLPERYGLSLSGIKQEEKISLGETRRINVLVRKPYTVNQTDVINNIKYRVYVKIGPAQMTVIDWSEVSRSHLHNFFILDTTWMLPNKYYVDLKISQNGETLLYNDQLVFNIVSRKKLLNEISFRQSTL